MATAPQDRRKGARPDDPERRGRRDSPRAQIVLPATVDALSGRQQTSLLDISRDGACLQGERLPDVGKDVVLKCGAVDAFGTVTWVVSTRCGVRFDEPISVSELMALREIAAATEETGITPDQAQATADWMNGLAR